MSRRGTVLFAAIGVIWGIPYLLIKVAVDDMAPSVLVFGRTAIGAALLLPVAASRRQLRPLVAHWRPLLAYTVIEVAGPWLLLATAEQRLTSSLTALLVATTPLVGAVLAWSLGDRGSLGATGIVGLAVGLAGVALLVGFDVGGADLPSVAMVLGVAAGYAIGPAIFARKLAGVPPLGVAAVSIAACSIGFAPVAALNLPSSAPPAGALLAVAVLGIVCTALAFVLFFELITEVGPVRATVITYVNPAVALVLGVAFLGEPVGLATAAGFVLVLAGSFLATTHKSRSRVLSGSAVPVAEP